MESKDSLVFDTLGTTIPQSEIKKLRAILWANAAKYGVSEEEVKQLQQYCQMAKDSEEFRTYARRTGPLFAQLVYDGETDIVLYDDVRPAFELARNLDHALRILSKGTTELSIAIYDTNGLLHVIGRDNIHSTTVELEHKAKTDPACYLEFQERVLTPAGERFRSYTSDDPAEVNACREAFGINDADVWFIDRGQEGKDKLASGTKVSKSLYEIVKNYE